ncbi:MAG: ATP-binding cassette domain-containing protein [Gammaproteobacteria bacterium]|jgi:polar amino acid transport system ATP-binding protein
MLSINNLCKAYVGANLFKNFSLEITARSIVGLTGPSGSGKSTLLRCIQHLENIDSGEIIVNGKAGFIFQDFQLFPHMTVLDNIIYAPVKVLNQPKEVAKKAAEDLLQQLGLLEQQHKYPAALSGGQKQRVAVARSLIMHPDLLLCDEPTSGLDLGSIIGFKQLLQQVHSMGVTMIIASHDINFLAQIASRILVLKHGVIVQDLSKNDFSGSLDLLKDALLA